MSTGLWVAVLAVVVALAFGAYRAVVDGRFRGTRQLPPSEKGPEVKIVHDPLRDVVPLEQRGERATLVQFSTAFCAPCRVTRRTLADVAAVVPGVRHVEVDAEQHLEVVRSLGVLRTPTTLVLDGAGREVTRAAGAPRKEQVLAALADALPQTDHEG